MYHLALHGSGTLSITLLPDSKPNLIWDLLTICIFVFQSYLEVLKLHVAVLEGESWR